VATAVTLVAAGLLALPPRAQRLAVSLLVVVHFGGIATAIFADPPLPNASPSWLAAQLNARFYKAYLELLGLGCNYATYTYGDKPRVYLWFSVTYADGEQRWITVPGPDRSRSSLAYIRLLDLGWELEHAASSEVSEELLASRLQAGKRFDPPMPEPGDDLSQEYLEPTPYAKSLLSSIARHVARNYPHPGDPAQAVTGVKIYRVAHRFLTPAELRAGDDPNDPTTYLAYYQGDYKPDGQLSPSCSEIVRVATEDVEVRHDPLLYWLIPIVPLDDGTLMDYVALHAESDK
jgi:hypothetical protein